MQNRIIKLQTDKMATTLARLEDFRRGYLNEQPENVPCPVCTVQGLSIEEDSDCGDNFVTCSCSHCGTVSKFGYPTSLEFEVELVSLENQRLENAPEYRDAYNTKPEPLQTLSKCDECQSTVNMSYVNKYDDHAGEETDVCPACTVLFQADAHEASAKELERAIDRLT